MKTLRVLIIEDNDDDADLLLRQLIKANFDVEHARVHTAEGVRSALADQTWDVILSDYGLRDFTGLNALEILQESGLDIPFLIISGSIGEETAAALMRQGVNDYLMKDSLKRLAPAIAREMQEAENRREKREAELALAQSEARLKLALNAAGLGAWERDLKTHEVFWSGEASEILGTSVAGAKLDDIHWQIVEEDRELVRAKYKEAVDSRKPISVKFRIRRRDGEIIWVVESAQCEYDASGTPLRLVGTIRDITRDKKAEDGLIEAEERFRVMAESASDAVISIDENSKILYANPATQRVFGYEPTELVGQALTVLMPDDIKERHRTGIQRYVETGTRKLDWSRTETTGVKKDGSRIDIQISFGHQRKANKDFFTGYIRDISEAKAAEDSLRRSEQNFRALVQATTHYVWQLDTAGNITEHPYWWEELTGQDFESSKNYGWLEHIHSDDQEKVKSGYLTAIASGGPVALELRIRNRTGEYRYYSASGVPTPSEAGIRWICALSDITPQRSAELAVRESEERLRTILNTEPECVKILSPDGKLLDINPAGVKILEAESVDQLVGQGADGILLPEYVAGFNSVLERAMAGEPVEYAYEICGLKGTRRWLEMHAVPLRSPDGTITSVLGVSRDVTEKRRTEASLKESQEKYSDVIHTVDGIVWEVDVRTFLFTFVSKQAETILGYPVEQWSTENFWVDHIHSQDRDWALKFCIDATKRGEPHTFEYRMVAADGRTVWLRDIVTVVSENGEPTLLRGIMVDVTEQRRLDAAMKRQALIIEQANEAIFVWDLETGIVEWNKGCERLYGYSREEALEKFGFEILQSKMPMSREQFIAELKAKGYWNGEVTQITKDGRTVYAESHFQLIDHDGRPVVLETNRDKTDSRKAEIALRRSEMRYRQLFASNPYPMWVYDVETYRFLAVNDAAVYRYGYSVDEFLAMTILDIRPQEDIPKILERAKSLKPRIDSTGNWRHTKKDGSVINVEITSHALEFEGKNARLVLANDISDRLMAEEAVKRSESKYRDLFENANDLIYTHDLGGKITSLNHAGERITGYTEAEALNFKISNVVAPEFRELQKEMMEKRRDGVPPMIYETEIIAKDGRRVPLEVSTRLIVENGKPVGVQGIGRDVTERRRAEEEIRRQRERLEKTAEAAPSAIRTFRLGPDGSRSFPYSSPAVNNLFGATPEDLSERTGDYLARIHKNDRDNVMRATEKSAADLSMYHVTFRYDHPTKGERWMETYAAPTRESDGSTLWHGITNDITEQKLAEEALRSSEEQLRQAQKLESIGILAGGMAHDFNNMLTAINGYSELVLRRMQADDPLRKHIEEIRKAGERSAELTNQLLAFSRRQILQTRVLDLNETITETISMLQRLIGEDIRITTKLSDDLRAIEADPGQLSQVLMNLSINARDAMPRGGSLVIETANVELDEEYATRHVDVRPGRFAMLAVSDTGIGMDEETKRRAFEPFFTTKPIGRGTGLGLSTVYGIVRQSGGNIWVYSEPGTGTTFKIYLPEARSSPTEKFLENSQRDLRIGSEKILLVEDEETVRSLAREILESCGYTVVEASNGIEALEKFEEIRDDAHLLITDIVMPEMGGRELSEKITNLAPGIKILFTSGYTDDAILRHGIIGDGTNFLQKPFTFDALAQKVRVLLDNH